MLYVSKLPVGTSSGAMHALFSSYGKVKDVWMLSPDNSAIVSYESLGSAIIARDALHNRAVFENHGPIQVILARPTSSFENSSPASSTVSFAQPKEPVLRSHSTAAANFLLKNRLDLLEIAKQFEMKINLETVESMIASAIEKSQVATEIRPSLETLRSRQFEASKLREIRKNIDSGFYTQEEIEVIATSMLDDVAELSSDYLGNTVIQKFFEYCSDPVKEAMLERIAPYLAAIGIHKNGTWAAQKIIDVASTDFQMELIVAHLRPYAALLYFDQFGNYVAQCCLHFRYPNNCFLFETMARHCCEIGQSRFGARAIRACLENEHATFEQQALVVAAIIINSHLLAINTNGMLLLTWLLDNSFFKNRHRLLAIHLAAHLHTTCTHKLASTLIFKLINNKQEPESRNLLLKNIFFSENDSVLTYILQDQAVGPSFVHKVITYPSIGHEYLTQFHMVIKRVLNNLHVQPTPLYYRLMEEVGMTSKSLSPALSGISMTAPSLDSASSRLTRDFGSLTLSPSNGLLNGVPPSIDATPAYSAYQPAAAPTAGLGNSNGAASRKSNLLLQTPRNENAKSGSSGLDTSSLVNPTLAKSASLSGGSLLNPVSPLLRREAPTGKLTMPAYPYASQIMNPAIGTDYGLPRVSAKLPKVFPGTYPRLQQSLLPRQGELRFN
ncbi:pumilio family RNA-binding protein Puf1 [Schizosaccharomyces osmophilus]|uniref:Pumilio family RNA-binding protein Puf1 n=1 Tax=Schizosaccharomyces osmophilus TaxID=2545709 RepID=A0AAE9WA08_9SCHI|nr:pumilio family RNA-binding protein Puf1 [Schizosaccharomyces osmophilus]WBW70733.1 pumilio family RNA-binding protein Puf1 [Schizosaccharomyces osmophilus]